MDNATLYYYGVLAAMGFTLVTLVLYTLAHQLKVSIDRHDLIRNARLQQQAYLRSVELRRRGMNADYGGEVEYNVDIVDDEEDGPAGVIGEEVPMAKAA